MSLASVDNILEIIALSVLADKKVFPVEVDSFISMSQNIPSLQNANPSLSDIWLRGWYGKNKIKLITTMQSASFEAWFRKGLDNVADKEDRRAIIKAMQAVATSDDEFHHNEKALIKFTAKHWNIELH